MEGPGCRKGHEDRPGGLRRAELGSGMKRLPVEDNAARGFIVWDTGARAGHCPSLEEKDDKWAAF